MMLPTLSLYSPQQMALIDNAAIEVGVSLQTLVYMAGTQAAEAIHQRWPDKAVVVLCGPGNNGADGWVAAQHLRSLGHAVRVLCPQPIAQANAQVQWAASLWPEAITHTSVCDVQAHEVVVDALFGTGLARSLSPMLQQWAVAIQQLGVPVCALDIASGVDGATGAVQELAFKATLTLAFVSAKPGHYLLPGRAHTGELHVLALPFPLKLWQQVQEGHAGAAPLGAVATLNLPALWQQHVPVPEMAGHKYTRGHVCVVGGESLTGAARLAAMAAQRVGSGLTSVLTSAQAWPVYATALPSSIMVQAVSPDTWGQILSDTRQNAWLVGPGLGLSAYAKQQVLGVLAAGKTVVVDADALTAFAGESKTLAQHISAPCVITPHEGEFARLFSRTDNKLQDVLRAAQQVGAVVVLKGADTVIASPDGRVAINANAPAYLATGGSGDVLAGVVCGLLAQGVAAFEAACMAVWLHSEAAQQCGVGLVPEDLLAALPTVQQQLLQALPS